MIKPELNSQETGNNIRALIKTYKKNPEDPFFITDKGKEIAKRFKAIEKIMES